MGALSWVTKTLDRSHSHYQETQHEKSYTAQQLAHEEHMSGNQVAKSVLVMVNNYPLMLVIPASRKVNLSAVSSLTGLESVRLASEAEVEFHLKGSEPGATPPMRHWSGIDIWVDDTLATKGSILFPAGTLEDAILMPYREWFELVKPRVECFSEPIEQGASTYYRNEEEDI